MRKVTQYEAKDGRRFGIEWGCRKHEAALDGLTHECPKCGGHGDDRSKPLYFTVVHRGPEPNSVDGWGAHQCVVHERRFDQWMPCDLCDGRGWTKTVKVPITRTEVIGYA